MKEWLLLPKENNYHSDLFPNKIENKAYNLFFSDNFGFASASGVSLLVDGYVLPRLGRKAGNNPKDILTNYLVNGEQFTNDYKGIFTIIIFASDQVRVYSDQLGILKYYYKELNDGGVCASSSLKAVCTVKPTKLSLENIYLYYTFNYFIEGLTQFDKIFHITGGKEMIINEKGVKVREYFNIGDFVNHQKRMSKKEAINRGSELWKDLIRQYLDHFGRKGLSQTLTAGLDSRLILAGLRAEGVSPVTFTFGLGSSMDVIHAKKLAAHLKIRHYHFYPENEFFDNYSETANKIITLGNGLETIYRGHRVNSFERLAGNEDIKAIFFGFAGSEVIRGLFPDRLLIPDIIVKLWTSGKNGLKEFLLTLLKRSFLIVDEDALEKLVVLIETMEFLESPTNFLFRVMIPMHFGQDIRLLHRMNIDSLVPYCDIDFIEFQSQTHYFTDDSRKEVYATLGNFKRRKGPYFSSKLITIIDPENAKFSLGKGYSPKEYSQLVFYAGLKFIWYKKFVRSKQTPNFMYEEWYRSFLKENFNSQFALKVGINEADYTQTLGTVSGTDEWAFLRYTQFTNLLLTQKLICDE